MSDHGAGPRSIANPEIDITDVFCVSEPRAAGPSRAGDEHISIQGDRSHTGFSSRTHSRLSQSAFVPFALPPRDQAAAFTVGEEVNAFSFIFEVPQASGDSLVQSGTCHGPAGKISVRVGDEAGAAFRGAPHLRRVPPRSVFHRPTVFWRDQAQPADSGKLNGVNSVEGQNVPGIVVEVEHSRLFGRACWTALRRSDRRDGDQRFGSRARLDRVGRPGDQELHHDGQSLRRRESRPRRP